MSKRHHISIALNSDQMAKLLRASSRKGTGPGCLAATIFLRVISNQLDHEEGRKRDLPDNLPSSTNQPVNE